MSRFVGATTVTSGDRHRITTWTSLAARLASVRAPQGRRMMALYPLSSEHGVLGSAGKASVFAKKASSVRSRCLYVDYGWRDGASPVAPSHGKSPTAAPRRRHWSYPSYHVLWPPGMVQSSSESPSLHHAVEVSMAQLDACHV